MKYCANCGAAIDDQVRFCPECGMKQEETAAAADSQKDVPVEQPKGTETGYKNEQPPAPPTNTPPTQSSYAPPPAPPAAPVGNNGYWQGGVSASMQYSYPQPQPKPKSNGLAIAGFVVSLCTILFIAVPVIGLIMSLIGLGLSIAGMVVANRNEGAVGMAVAGLVLSIIFLITTAYVMFAMIGYVSIIR